MTILFLQSQVISGEPVYIDGEMEKFRTSCGCFF